VREIKVRIHHGAGIDLDLPSRARPLGAQPHHAGATYIVDCNSREEADLLILQYKDQPGVSASILEELS
jgi:hypothetical protein